MINLLLCSHSHNDGPREPQWNVSMATVRGAVHLSIKMINTVSEHFKDRTSLPVGSGSQHVAI